WRQNCNACSARVLSTAPIKRYKSLKLLIFLFCSAPRNRTGNSYSLRAQLAINEKNRGCEVSHHDHQIAERIPASRSIPHIWPPLVPTMLKWKVIGPVTYLTLPIRRLVYTHNSRAMWFSK